jgi:hypothetical protein
MQTLHMTVVLGGKSGTPSSAVRRPRFVSPSTKGIDIKVYAQSGTTVLSEAQIDISGPPACSSASLPRTCAIAVSAPAGMVDVVSTTYDAPPVAGSFAGAHVLATGKLTANVSMNSLNGVSLYLSGVIDTLGYLAPNESVPADGATHVVGFVLNPADFGNNPISASGNDPYQNPITVTLAESGGSGHMHLVKNGDNAGLSTTLTYSNESISVSYDGGGTAGYNATVTVSAAGVTPSESLLISPLYVTSGSTYALNANRTFTFDAANETAAVDFSETGAPATTAYTATASPSCAGIASVSAASGTGTAATATVTALTTGSCTIVFSDGTSSLTWTAGVMTTPTGTIVIGSHTVGPITLDGYANGPVQGQHGWLSDKCGWLNADANVVDTSTYPSAQWPGTAPGKALQIDNGVFQACYTGLGSPVNAYSAGYPNALTDTTTTTPQRCGTTCENFFTTQFVVTSATGGFQQDLALEILPVWSDQGGRMAEIGLWHTTDAAGNPKLLVFTASGDGLCPLNTFQTCGYNGPAPCYHCEQFAPFEVAYVDPSTPHTIGMTIAFVQPDNDVVTIYVDGVQAGVQKKTFRTFEDYWLFDTESDPGYKYPYSRAVNDLLFMPQNFDSCKDFADYLMGCGMTPYAATNPKHGSTVNNGFLFTNLTTCAGTETVCDPAIDRSSRNLRRTTTTVRPGRAGRAPA